MTAVDHAELKRLVSRLRAVAGDYIGKVDRASCIETEAADGLDALLSEIEGLKAANKDHCRAVNTLTLEAVEFERQVADLRASVVRANAGFEEYERKFYLATDDVDRLKLAICGGEDAPGAVNAVSVEDCERFVAEERSFHRWAHEECGKLQALLSLRTQAPDSWRPIETAPKDGTVIDVWRDYGERDTVFWGLPHHDCGEMGQHCDSDWHSIRAPGWVCNTFNEFVGRNHNPFTHWMPLPAAPALRPQTAESGK